MLEERISFAEWLVELNVCAANAGYKAERYFTQIAGQLEWHSYYQEGLTPEAALEQAVKDGFEYGEHYENC